MKCKICHQKEYLWDWQPFGPDESPRDSFVLPGNFYRGFPVIKVCQMCKEEIQMTGTAAPAVIVFKYRGLNFGFVPRKNRIEDSPF